MKEFDDIDVLDLLPQRPPFVMIGHLESFTEEVTVTTFTITEDNIFVTDGEMDEEGVVENVAQTCAARMGYMNKYVKLGFIGAIKDMTFIRKPKVGETLTTRVEVISEVLSITLVKATVTASGEEISSCQMKISLTDIDKKE